MTTTVRTISTIMVKDVVLCESNVMVLLTIVAEGCTGCKKGECVFVMDDAGDLGANIRMSLMLVLARFDRETSIGWLRRRTD